MWKLSGRYAQLCMGMSRDAVSAVFRLDPFVLYRRGDTSSDLSPFLLHEGERGLDQGMRVPVLFNWASMQHPFRGSEGYATVMPRRPLAQIST